MPERRSVWTAVGGHTRDVEGLSADAFHRATDSLCFRPRVAAASGNVLLAIACCDSDPHPVVRHQRSVGICDGDARVDWPLDREVFLQSSLSWRAWDGRDSARLRDGWIVQIDQSRDRARTQREWIRSGACRRTEVLRRLTRARW